MCHAAKTIRRNLDWRDEESIFLSGLTVNAKAHLSPPPPPTPPFSVRRGLQSDVVYLC
jgi:hypothetical protein